MCRDRSQIAAFLENRVPLQLISRLRLSWRDTYYGWFVVAACNGVAFITWGVTIFNQGVFLGVFVRDYGWSPATLSVGPVLFHLCAGMAGGWVGRIVDRQGPRLVLIAGAVLIGLGMIGFGFVREPWHTYPVFLVLGCGFTCIHTITLGKIITRWFVRHRVRAMAAATFGAGLGGAILVPLNAAVIEGWGILAGGVVLAAITLGVIVPLALWVIKEGPEAVGQEPDGGLVEDDSQSATDKATDSHPWTVPEAMRTVAFWGLSICFALGMAAQGGYLVHQVMFLQMSLGLIGAASIVTVTTLMGMVGRVGFMLIGPRLSPRVWVALMFVIQAVSFLLLAIGSDPTLLLIGSALFGLTMGVIVVLQPLATASVFGQQAFGRIYGPIYMSIRIGSGAGPLLAGVLVAATGNYQAVWLLLAASLFVGCVGIFWAMSASRP